MNYRLQMIEELHNGSKVRMVRLHGVSQRNMKNKIFSKTAKRCPEGFSRQGYYELIDLSTGYIAEYGLYETPNEGQRRVTFSDGSSYISKD